jgi:hypothetical protein
VTVQPGDVVVSAGRGHVLIVQEGKVKDLTAELIATEAKLTTAETQIKTLEKQYLVPTNREASFEGVVGELAETNKTLTATLPAPATGAQWSILNWGTGVVTVKQHAAEVIFNGQGESVTSCKVLPSGGVAIFESDGGNWFVINGSGLVMDQKDLPLAAAWENYGGGWPHAQYSKDSNGLVKVDGLVKIKAGSTYVFGTSENCTIGTLPVGYRPATEAMFVTWQEDSSGSKSSMRTDVYANGEIKLITSAHSATGEGNNGKPNYLSLWGISFYAGGA